MIEIVASIVSTVGAGWILNYLIRVRGPVRVKRITSASDPLVSQTLELYQNLFPEDDGTNYSVDECVEFMDECPVAEHHISATNIVLVATFKGSVVGFIFAHLYVERRKAIISYFAIDKSVKEARIDGIAAKKLMTALKTALLKRNNCDVMFYDVERISPSSTVEDRKRKLGRAGLFRVHAKAMGLEAREFQFQYQCPRVSMSEFTHEQPFALFCVGVSAPLPREVTKQTMMDYLRFIYLDCYGDIYPKDDLRFASHQEHLQKMIKHYEQTLPDKVLAM